VASKRDNSILHRLFWTPPGNNHGSISVCAVRHRAYYLLLHSTSQAGSALYPATIGQHPASHTLYPAASAAHGADNRRSRISTRALEQRVAQTNLGAARQPVAVAAARSSASIRAVSASPQAALRRGSLERLSALPATPTAPFRHRRPDKTPLAEAALAEAERRRELGPGGGSSQAVVCVTWLPPVSLACADPPCFFSDFVTPPSSPPRRGSCPPPAAASGTALRCARTALHSLPYGLLRPRGDGASVRCSDLGIHSSPRIHIRL
jgi:hypothetical protein